MPSLASNGQQPPPPPLVGLSTSGKLFFGSLCVGTFGLGMWQLQRLLGKQKQIEERTSQLQMEPTRDLSSWKSGSDSESTDSNSNRSDYRRRLVQGVFRYDHEILVGPRGAPPGVQPERKGMSAKQKGNGASSGGAPGPQGYHVLTPLEVRVPFSSDGPTKNATVVWVNRGWIPKTILPQKEGNRGRSREDPPPKPIQEPDTPITWKRPPGLVEITAVQTSVEKPRTMTPKHDFAKRPPRLFWLDPSVLQAIIQEDDPTEAKSGASNEMVLLTQVQADQEEQPGVLKQQQQEVGIQYPMTPNAQAVGDFRTTPMIHAGYAATWFGLSGAGLYMTRMLITRGRG